MHTKAVDVRNRIELITHTRRRDTRFLFPHDVYSFQGATLKLLAVAAMASASFTLMPAAQADQTMNSDMSHADTYVKDSVITTKVKAKLAEKHLATLTNIHVDTDRQGIVWLSGNAPTQDASDLAEMIAKSTEGVVSVHNKIVVQQ